MKPIEPGCMAVTLWARNPTKIGLTVKVIKIGVSGDVYKGCILGRSHKENSWIVESEYLEDGWGWWSEKNLLRIDGYEDDKSIEEITKELTV